MLSVCRAIGRAGRTGDGGGSKCIVTSMGLVLSLAESERQIASPDEDRRLTPRSEARTVNLYDGQFIQWAVYTAGICENQRSTTVGLMSEEYSVKRFHDWVRAELRKG